jgi:hypothetical protein
MTTEKPTPPAGFKLVNGYELKAPFDPKLVVWTDEDVWDESYYAGSANKKVDECDLDSWYAIPDEQAATPEDCPQSLLDAAKKIIEERGQDYGDSTKSFERIAKFWSAYKGVEITPKDVAAMMMLLKISRWVTSDKPDTLLDIVGYAECASKLNKAEV